MKTAPPERPGRPLQNRVTPYGQIVALPGRGLVVGNRGVIHDEARRIVRQWKVRRWIACRLEFKGRRRTLMQPRRWTELFFLDEATAFAAGHRPWAECRREDFQKFVQLWMVCHGGSGRADEVDRRLHADRLCEFKRKKTYRDDVARLPPGTYVVLDGFSGLLVGDRFYAWSDSGYVWWRPRPRRGKVEVLTPRAIVGVLRAGYVRSLHPSLQTAPRLRG